MDNKPQALTGKEIKEIALMKDIREMWGAEDVAEMEELLEHSVYAVRFNYASNTAPSYVGDYFILQGDALGEALELIRDNDGVLQIL